MSALDDIKKFDELMKRVTDWDVTVLQDPDIGTVRDKGGNTVLHYAATKFIEALDHPDVSKVHDGCGATPLHWAAYRVIKAKRHPDFSKVQDFSGKTPEDWVSARRSIFGAVVF